MDFNYTIHYELCDDILNNIREGNDMHEVNIENFLKEDRRVKLAIVRKLNSDGYIRRVHAQSQPFIISITVEGVQFWMDGGYKKKFEELREKYKLENRLLQTNIETNISIKRSNRIQKIVAIAVGIFILVSTFYQAKTYYLEHTKYNQQQLNSK